MGPICVTEIDGHKSGQVSLANIFIQLDATGELTYKPEQQFCHYCLHNHVWPAPLFIFVDNFLSQYVNN